MNGIAVRAGGVVDAPDIARLLHAFNVEFDEPTPSAHELARRVEELLEGGDTAVLLAGDGPDGVAVLRFRLAIWSRGRECYLAELYVVPSRRGRGLGGALLDAAMDEARRRGADSMDIGVDEPDVIARRLYESRGFSNRTDGGVMYVYERGLVP